MKVGDLVQLLTPRYYEPIEEMIGIVLGFSKSGRVQVRWADSTDYGGAWQWGRLKVISESR